jgi:hypothetical protein
MMDGGAMQALVDVAQKAAAPSTVNVNGEYFARHSDGLVQVRVKPAPIDTLELPDLQGIVSYYQRNPEGARDPFFVVTPRVVKLFSMDAATGVRQKWAEAICADPEEPSFATPSGAIDWLLGNCDEGENRDELVAILSTVRKDSEVQLSDDGMTQRVTTKSGVALVDATVIRPYYTLISSDAGFPELPVRVRTLRYRVRVTESMGVRFSCIDRPRFESVLVAEARAWLEEKVGEGVVI